MHLFPFLKGILIGLLISVPTGAVGFLCIKRALTHHWKASMASALGSPGLEKYEHLGNFASTFSLTMTNPIQIITLPVVFAAIGTDVTPNSYSQALLFLLGLGIGACFCWIILISGASYLKRYIKEHHFSLINRISGTVIIGTGIYVLVSLIVTHLR